MRSSLESSNRILIVDDEVGIRATLSPILQRNGFTVRSVASAPEAIQEIQTRPFDALICDLKLGPNEDPYAIVRTMRQVNPQAVVIIFTGYPELDTAIEAVREAVDDYILKPSDSEVIVNLLRQKLLSRPRKPRVLSLSYDHVLLKTRNMLLEREGYEVVSADSLATGLAACHTGHFDVFVLGHSIPSSDKRQMVEAFRQACPGVVISLRRNTGEGLVDGADFHIDPDPESLLATIASIVKMKASPTN
jgi:DNA-binding NtrC family response regulator